MNKNFIGATLPRKTLLFQVFSAFSLFFAVNSANAMQFFKANPMRCVAGGIALTAAIKGAFFAIKNRHMDPLSHKLIEAIREGYLPGVEGYLGLGADPNRESINSNREIGTTLPLREACKKMNLDMVKMLVDQGANVNGDYEHAVVPRRRINGKTPVRVRITVLAEVCYRLTSDLLSNNQDSRDKLMAIFKYLVEQGANVQTALSGLFVIRRENTTSAQTFLQFLKGEQAGSQPLLQSIPDALQFIDRHEVMLIQRDAAGNSVSIHPCMPLLLELKRIVLAHYAGGWDQFRELCGVRNLNFEELSSILLQVNPRIKKEMTEVVYEEMLKKSLKDTVLDKAICSDLILGYM